MKLSKNFCNYNKNELLEILDSQAKTIENLQYSSWSLEFQLQKSKLQCRKLQMQQINLTEFLQHVKKMPPESKIMQIVDYFFEE